MHHRCPTRTASCRWRAMRQTRQQGQVALAPILRWPRIRLIVRLLCPPAGYSAVARDVDRYSHVL